MLPRNEENRARECPGTALASHSKIALFAILEWGFSIAT